MFPVSHSTPTAPLGQFDDGIESAGILRQADFQNLLHFPALGTQLRNEPFFDGDDAISLARLLAAFGKYRELPRTGRPFHVLNGLMQ